MRTILIKDTIDAAEQLYEIERATNAGLPEDADRETLAFFRAVAGWIEETYCFPCSITGAFMVWRFVTGRVQGQRRKTERFAELAFWFKVNPFALTDSQRVGLWSNLNSLKAQEILHNGNFDATDYKAVYDLYMAAYDDEERAQKAKTKAAEVYVDTTMAAKSGTVEQ